MTKVAITGSGGFLGLHLRAAAHAQGIETVGIPLGKQFNAEQAKEACRSANTIIHLAGVNRGTDQEIVEGNALFAQQLSATLRSTPEQPQTLVYANSIHAGSDSVYGEAKHHVAEVLAATAAQRDMSFQDVRLPNIFGEYGRPFYNSVVATFSHLVANGDEPDVQQDRELPLLHAQNAADILLGTVGVEELETLSHQESVTGIKLLLEEFHQLYISGEFPLLSTDFRRDLFNTYRSYTFPVQTPIDIARHADQRGAFFEITRSHGGPGQTSFSTTVPGITRGDHYHRRKIERFTVLAGEAEIRLRRLFDDEVFTYRISGDQPKSVDMPTLYTHNIQNVGTDTLYTAFWTNDIFDPDHPDTITEPV